MNDPPGRPAPSDGRPPPVELPPPEGGGQPPTRRLPWLPDDPVVYGPYGLRAGWRILVFFILTFVAAYLLGAVAVVLGVAGTMTAGFAVLLLAALAAGWIMLRHVDGRPARALGFALDAGAPREAGGGFLIGAAAIGAAVLLLGVTGTAWWVAEPGTIPEYAAVLAATFAFFAIAAAAEEVVFRGYAFQALVQGIGPWPAVVVSSAVFAAAHALNPNVTALGLLNIFLAGVLLAVVYLRTRSLWNVTALHLAWNWVMASLLDFPVSGWDSDTPLYGAEVRGPEWWTGGAFGPEGGLAATAVLAAAAVWAVRTARLRAAPGMLRARPLVDDRIGKEWT